MTYKDKFIRYKSLLTLYPTLCYTSEKMYNVDTMENETGLGILPLSFRAFNYNDVRYLAALTEEEAVRIEAGWSFEVKMVEGI